MADRFERLNDYLGSWSEPHRLVSALADDFVLDDPAEPFPITKATFADWMARRERNMRAIGGTGRVEAFDAVEYDHDGILLRWSWWHFVGTNVEGASIVKVTDRGVAHHRIAYFGPCPVPLWQR